MEQTQLLDWDGEADPDDPSDGAGGAWEPTKPVGRLHLLSSKYGPEKDFWIYPGENVIGRLESCQICLPMASVSKVHAVIEVPSPDGPHLLYDQGSLNRTRRQRAVLIPQVRYSLQDGDALLFGDVGCQYFMLVPGGDSESPNDSMEVPPTQAKEEASTLAIEETPAPGRRRMGFGGILVQDSDKEEEEEEPVNGASRILHLSGPDGSDSSIKDSTRGDSNSAASKFFSPSATVVPESDEESGEPSGSSPSDPSLRLSFESHIADRGHLENGAVTPSNQDGHPAQPKTMKTEPKATPHSEEPAAKEEETPTHPSLIDFHLDSDTDVEDEKGTVSSSEMPGSRNLAKDGLSLEVGSDTDSEEPVVANPDIACKKDHQIVIDVGSDTDVEEAAESSSVAGLKPQQPAQNEDDMDVEGAGEDLGTASPESCGVGPPNEGSDKGAEETRGNAKGHQPDEKRDSSASAEEAVNNPGRHLWSQQSAENEDSDTDVEEASIKLESAREAHEATRDSSDDTDVEVVDAELEAPGGDGPCSSCPTSCRDGSMDGEEISPHGVVLQGDDNLAAGSGGDSGTQEMKNVSTEAQSSQGVSSEQSSSLDVKEPLENPAVVENPASLPPKQYLPMLSVDSDTDVEEASESPEVKESHRIAGNGPRERDVESPLEDPDAGPQKSSGPGQDQSSDIDVEVVSPTHKLPGPGGDGGSDTDVEVVSPTHRPPEPGGDEGSDTDVEVVSPTHGPPGPGGDGGSDTDVEVISPTQRATVTQDSYTDVEEVIAPLPGKAIEEQDTQLVPVGSWVDGKKSASSAAEHEPCEEEEDIDADGHGSHAGDDSNAADDPDLVFQATQCYLPAITSSPKPGKAREITGLACSSPLKDDDSDPDDYMLEATQAFCKGPGLLSEEPTQAFVAEEEETELFFQHPPEGGELSEQPTQAAFPVLASRARQADCLSESSTQLYSIGLPCSSKSVSQPAGGTAAEKSEEKEEIQPVGSLPVPSADGNHPSVLQEAEEVVRSQEQLCVAASDAGSPAEHSQAQRRAGDIDSGSKERSSTPAGGAGNAEQPPEHSTEEPSEPVASVPARRRSLRSSSAAVSPAVPERRSSRRGHVEGANTDVSRKAVAHLTRRRGLRQLGDPTQYMGEPEKKMEQPEGEDLSPNKKPRNGELTVVACRSRARGLQPESSADSGPKEETEVAVDSPGTRGPTRRGQRRTAAELVEKQPELPRTRASRRSGGSSATTPSRKDSGEAAKPRREPAEPTSSSRRRSRRQSTESKPVETRAQPRNRSRISSASSTPVAKVLFTGVIDEEGEHVITELGGSLAESVFDCTHLVTDRVRRTVKFLCALARGIPIVTLDWLEKAQLLLPGTKQLPHL
ncbi:mediator of DNA damage checkpoint protein 1 isoform X2 [Tiliqua scincoides]|uniref:mediator of DNA damage checkpoint protein 1 isoform X2 n=1 Tax=Tiliqua scincoides TaxID=71010 RepID=UPI00346371B0